MALCNIIIEANQIKPINKTMALLKR